MIQCHNVILRPFAAASYVVCRAHSHVLMHSAQTEWKDLELCLLLGVKKKHRKVADLVCSRSGPLPMETRLQIWRCRAKAAAL